MVLGKKGLFSIENGADRPLEMGRKSPAGLILFAIYKR